MTEFDKWYKNSGQGWAFPTDSTNEPKFEIAWKAALEWIKRELYEVRAHGFIPDQGLSYLLKKELEETENG
jgi:hypothetical protein